MIELVAARLTHVGPLATRMRAADVAECEAFGRSPKQSLRLCLRCSLWSLTAMKDGRPAAMLGVASESLMSGKGSPWMLGTDEVYRHGRDLLRLGPIIVDEMLKSFQTLENMVSVKNGRAIRVLDRWGFEVGGKVQEVGGLAFVPFRMSRFKPDAEGATSA